MTMGTSLPFVSVIVPIYNPDDGLSGLVDALRMQDYPSDRYEIIFVDDGSNKPAAQALINRLSAVGYPGMTVLSKMNGGSYSARNVGIAHAKGEVFAFTDADCSPRKYWLSSGIATLEREAADLAAGAINITFKNPQSVVETYDACFYLAQEYYAMSLAFGATANLFVTRAVINSTRGFDVSLRSGGDQDFCNRARQASFRLVFAADASVSHPARATMRDLIRKTRRVARGRADRFASPQNYLPRLMRSVVRLRNPERLASMDSGMIWRLRVLHMILEANRIGSYAGRRFEKTFLSLCDWVRRAKALR